MDHGALELALQYDRLLQLLNYNEKIQTEGHPSAHQLLLASGGYLVHDKELLSDECLQNNTCLCSCAIVCMLHARLVTPIRGTALITTVSHA